MFYLFKYLFIKQFMDCVGREDVERQVLAARKQAAATVKEALRILAHRHGGDGIEQSIHKMVNRLPHLVPDKQGIAWVKDGRG